MRRRAGITTRATAWIMIVAAPALASREAAAAGVPPSVELDADNRPSSALPVRSSFVLTKKLGKSARRATVVFVRYAYRFWNINPPKLRREFTTTLPIRPNDCAEVLGALPRDRFVAKSLQGIPRGRLDVSDLWREPPVPALKQTELGQKQLLDHKIYRYLDSSRSVYVPAVWTRDEKDKDKDDVSFQLEVEDKTFFRPGAQYCMYVMVEEDRVKDHKDKVATTLRGIVAEFAEKMPSTPDEQVQRLLYAALEDLDTKDLREEVCREFRTQRPTGDCEKSGVPARYRLDFMKALIEAIVVVHAHRAERFEELKKQLKTDIADKITAIKTNINALKQELGRALPFARKPPPPLFLDKTDLAGVRCHVTPAAPPANQRDPRANELVCLLFANKKIHVDFVAPKKTKKAKDAAPYTEDYLYNGHKIARIGLQDDRIVFETGEPEHYVKTSDLLLEAEKLTLHDLMRFDATLAMEGGSLSANDHQFLDAFLEEPSLIKALPTDMARLSALMVAVKRLKAVCERYPALGRESCASWRGEVSKSTWRADEVETRAGQLATHLAALDTEMKKVNAAFIDTELEIGGRLRSIDMALQLDQAAYVSSFVTPAVGVAFIPGPQTFAIPYAAAQIFFWPNHVDDPMWSNGRLDLRRLVAAEIGLGITAKNFGPDDRFMQLTNYNTPPVLYGLAFQLIPYSTFSIGGALMKVRRSTFAGEETSLISTLYLGLTVELNFFNLARGQFSGGNYSSAKAVLAPGLK